MTGFETMSLADAPQVVAPDGSDVRILPSLAGGSMAHFTLAPGVTSGAVTHRTVEEIWFVVSGRGEMWRASADREEIVELEPDVALTIPRGYSLPVPCVREWSADHRGRDHAAVAGRRRSGRGRRSLGADRLTQPRAAA